MRMRLAPLLLLLWLAAGCAAGADPATRSVLDDIERAQQEIARSEAAISSARSAREGLDLRLQTVTADLAEKVRQRVRGRD